jgi:hypothetical protein
MFADPPLTVFTRELAHVPAVPKLVVFPPPPPVALIELAKEVVPPEVAVPELPVPPAPTVIV